MTTSEEFGERYRIVGEPAMRRAELAVIGADYGSVSFTTRAQADQLAETLDLGPGRMLLDIGSGAGWPGVYMAQATGCRVLLSDVPTEGLRRAVGRLQAEGADGFAVAAEGALLPLVPSSFDAVSSSDVFCWLVDKLSVLRACIAVLKPGGRLGGFTITFAAGVTERQKLASGAKAPERIDSGPGYPALMEEAGYVDVDIADVTDEYRETVEAWIRAWDSEAVGIEPLVGPEEFADRQDRMHRVLRALDDGIRKRYLVSGTRG